MGECRRESIIKLPGNAEQIKAKQTPKDEPYYVCPVCGNTVAGNAPDICPICGTPGSKI